MLAQRKSGARPRLFAAADGFARHREAWAELHAAQGRPILLDPRFVAPLVRHFATPRTRLAVMDGGLALLEPIGIGRWETFQPSQAPLGLLLYARPEQAVPQTRALLRGLPGYAVALAVLRQDPPSSYFQELERWPHVERVDYIRTARLSLAGDWDGYWRSRSKNLTHNLGRQRRRLAERGSTLQLVAEADPARMEACVAEYGRLEQAGWKGLEGSAVAADNAQGAFYAEMLRDFAATGEAVVYRLELDGRTIAADLCLRRDGTLVVLKTAYDEGVQGLSPGLLLHQEILQRLYAEGAIRTLEFYGAVRDWHTKLTDDVRVMYHVNLHRNAWVTRARRWIKRVRA